MRTLGILSIIIWFAVRVILQMPPDTPLFYGNIFLWGDSLAAIIGLLGVAGLVGDVIE